MFCGSSSRCRGLICSDCDISQNNVLIIGENLNCLCADPESFVRGGSTLTIYFYLMRRRRCNSLSCPPGQLAPRGASCPGISCPPPWLSSPPGGKLSRPVYLAPHQHRYKYMYVIVLFFCIILMNSGPIPVLK